MSLTREDLEDIKQLMEAVMNAAMKEQDKKFARLEQRFDEAQELQNEILQAVSDKSASQGAVLDNHETRIIRLEKAAA